MENRNSDAQAIIDSTRALDKVELLSIGGGHSAASVPAGRQLESIKPLLDEYLERPERKTGVARITTLDAFCAYVNRHKGSGDTVVFVDDVDRKAPLLRATFNAHEATTETDAGKMPLLKIGRPDWQDFGAIYPFPLSDEWKAWTSLKAEYGQAEFAAFLEDRIVDVVEPGESVKAFASEIGAQLASAARLMELSRGLSIHVGGKVAQSVNLGTGECSLTFAEEHKDSAGAPLKVPGAFAIGIPVFRLGRAYQLPVRLRYRVQGGSVLWSLAPQRIDKAFDLAIREAADTVADRTGAPLFYGRLQG